MASEALTMTDRIRVSGEGENRHLFFMCPGCRDPHALDARWSWNGITTVPTFGPASPGQAFSLLVRWSEGGQGEERIKKCCHSYVEDGRIRFLDDCTHPLAGKAVAIPEWRGFDRDAYRWDEIILAEEKLIPLASLVRSGNMTSKAVDEWWLTKVTPIMVPDHPFIPRDRQRRRPR
jgi:hypothetical protein